MQPRFPPPPGGLPPPAFIPPMPGMVVPSGGLPPGIPPPHMVPGYPGHLGYPPQHLMPGMMMPGVPPRFPPNMSMPVPPYAAGPLPVPPLIPGVQAIGGVRPIGGVVPIGGVRPIGGVAPIGLVPPIAAPVLPVQPLVPLAPAVIPTTTINTPQFINPTSDFLNRSIFTNAVAGLPLTIFLGNVPLDLEDLKLLKIVECCGKIQKFVRPTDPVTQLPTNFALVTYNQGICALRAKNILDNMIIQPAVIDPATSQETRSEQRFIVKLGTKETMSLASIQQTETEAEKTLPEQMSLEDIYGPIKQAIDALLTVSEKAEDSEMSSKKESGTDEKDSSEAKKPAANSEALIGEDGKPINYYTFLKSTAVKHASGDYSLDIVGQNAVESSGLGAKDDAKEEAAGQGDMNVGEKFLLSEIERYRERQMQRDKELEELKKQKIQERIRQLEQLKKKQQQQAANGEPTGIPPPPTAPHPSSALSRKRTLNSHEAHGEAEDELETKRLRKLQVLEMLAEDNPEAKKSVSMPIVTKLKSNAGNNSNNNTMDDEDEEGQDKLANIPLLEDPDVNNTAGIVHHSYTDEVEEDDNWNDIVSDNREDALLAANKAKRTSTVAGVSAAAASVSQAAVNPLTSATALQQSLLQAKILAQTQLLNDALKSKQQQQQVTSSSSTNSSQPMSEDEKKERLRLLIDQLPKDNTSELFAIPVQWSLLHTHNVIESQLKTWIGSKIMEYLGEPEESLMAFLVGELKKPSGGDPKILIDELSMVLEPHEAESFVLKLWKMLLVYSLKCQHNL